ncbi:MAG: acyl--CoA ligase [Mogibacterium sp.]|nr:acyl--CoA ligase [Mogibacterium sp.]
MKDNRKPSITKPWLKYYDKDCINRLLPECSLYGQLKKSSAGCQDQTALEYYGALVSYKKLMDRVDCYAAAFDAIGVRAGDFVSFYTVSIPETIYSIYGLNKIGAVCNLIDIRTDGEHTKEFIEKAKSDVLIVLESEYRKIRDLVDETGLSKVIIQSASDSLPFASKIAFRHKNHVSIDFSDERLIRCSELEALGKGKAVDEVPYEKDRPAIVTRTGGTTGTSKGVVLTNDSLNAVYANFRDVVGSGRGMSFLNFLPLAASYGIACGIHMGLCMNVVDILIPKFKPDDFADLVYKYRPNVIIGVPLFYENLMHSEKIKDLDLSFSLVMAAGGDSANLGFEQRLREFTKERGARYPLAQGYGMSETSSASAFGVFDIHKDGSAGLPCIHNIISAFRPDTDEELDTGESGEICITGPTLMKEYLDEPEETAHVMRRHSDGRLWIHSGDIGYIDEDGFLFIKGRIKRSVVRFDGHKSYPVQIEDVVNKHPAVKNCCVIPVKDLEHEQGELPLILAEPAAEAGIDPEQLRTEIMELCDKGIEERSRPADAVIVDTIPMTANGKKDIIRLTEEYGDYDYLLKRS